MSAVIKFSVVLMLVGVCFADIKVCLGCMCQAISGCNLDLGCDGDACGPFKISSEYWSKAGQPTPLGVSPSAPDAYQRCTCDFICASKTVQNYMKKFGQDCNGDGLINCHDYTAIHTSGPSECNGGVTSSYVNILDQCL